MEEMGELAHPCRRFLATLEAGAGGRGGKQQAGASEVGAGRRADLGGRRICRAEREADAGRREKQLAGGRDKQSVGQTSRPAGGGLGVGEVAAPNPSSGEEWIRDAR